MNTEIDFGISRQRQPSRGPRPDTSPLLAVRRVSAAPDGELDVYIDIDVWRDVWEHASSNQAVELGGVLVGQAFVDNAGGKFVVVQGIIRAAHYEATRGSFTFTHESWREIARQQQLLPPEMVVVGWYHTHPGFGIFLSGQDTFICNHFFDGDHDLALVLDPCAGLHGWFVRNGSGELHQAPGFFLTAYRQRADELEAECRGVVPAGEPIDEELPARDDETDDAGETEIGESLPNYRATWMNSGQALLLIGLQSLAIVVLSIALWQAKRTPPAGNPTPLVSNTPVIPRSEFHDFTNERRSQTVYRDLLADTIGYETALSIPVSNNLPAASSASSDAPAPASASGLQRYWPSAVLCVAIIASVAAGFAMWRTMSLRRLPRRLGYSMADDDDPPSMFRERGR